MAYGIAGGLVRRALRRVRRTPGYYGVGFACLTLATGAAAAVFSVVDATLLRPFPYRDPGALVSIASTFTGPGTEPQRYLMSPANVEALRAGVPGLVVEAAQFGSFDVWRAGEVERVNGARVTPAWFDVLGQPAVVGRTLTAADGGAGRVALVSDAYWQRSWGGAGGPGETIRIDGVPYEIVGVVRRADALPTDMDVWIPLDLAGYDASQRRSGFLLTVGRLAPGHPLAVAQSRADVVAEAQGRIDPEVNRGRGLELRPLREAFVEDARPLLFALAVAVAVVLLIACLNVANLLLVRLRRESAEIAVRSVLGASGRSVLMGLLTDSVVLTAFAVAAGLGLARLIQPALFAVAGLSGPGFVAPGLDTRVVVFGAGLTLVTAAGFGLLPALAAVRSRSTLLTRHSARTGLASRSSRRFQGVLVAIQSALGLVLGLGASATALSFREVSLRDPGFNTAGVTTFRIGAAPTRYPGLESQAAFHARVQEATLSLPGVLSAGATNTLPIGDTGAGFSFSVEHHVPEEAGAVEVARGRLITPRYFESIGIRLIAGRDFEWSDRDGSEPVVIVSETLARRYWPGEGAVGKRIKRRTYDSPFPWMTVVGVVGDVRDDNLGEEIGATLYMPMAQVPTRLTEVMSFVYKADGDASRLMPGIRERLRALDPDAPVFRVTTMKQLVEESLSSARFVARLMVVFAGIGTALLAAGLYSLLAWIVADRTRELGVRLAIGATRHGVVRMFVAQGLRLVAIGLAGGSLIGLGVMPIVARFASDGVRPPAAAWLSIAALLLGVGVLASIVPAWRAARLDPAESLRADCG